MTIQELLNYLDGSGLTITDYNEIEEILICFDANLKSTVQLDGREL